MTDPLLSVEDLVRVFPGRRSLNDVFARRPAPPVRAVDGISFEVRRGEILALVGESGCGKTTTGNLLMGLLPPSAGRVTLDGEDVGSMSGRSLRRLRRKVQMVFQDPFASLNPVHTIRHHLDRPLRLHQPGLRGAARLAAMEAVLAHVKLDPALILPKYPHELSGGQRQRVAVARALVMNPSFIVADEPTSMLDVSIRISIMELMAGLAREFQVSYLYITHDLAVARYMCDRIAVMYLGKIVEIGPTEEILARPRHPYTRALLSAVPVPDPSTRRTAVMIKGGISKAINPPPECRFIARCPYAAEVCRTNPHPPLEQRGDRHFVACYRVDEIESAEPVMAEASA